MNRPEREAILRRLLVCAPDQTQADADKAVIRMAEGDCIPLIHQFNISHSDMIDIVRAAWAHSTDIEHSIYKAISDYLDRIGVPQEA